MISHEILQTKEAEIKRESTTIMNKGYTDSSEAFELSRKQSYYKHAITISEVINLYIKRAATLFWK